MCIRDSDRSKELDEEEFYFKRASELQKTRKGLNLSLKEVARNSGITYSMLWRVESGQSIRLYDYIKLCDYYAGVKKYFKI